MVTRIFDNAIVEKHPIYKDAGSALSEVSKRDYGNNFFDERIKCLDMDEYEVSVCQEQKQPTMDAVIGVADYERNRKNNSQLLMVELRLGYRSTNGLEAESLNGKILHTLELLNPARYIVAKQAVFVFNDNVYQQAISWMTSKLHSNVTKKEWVVMNPKTFGRAYLAQEDLPYEPMYDYEISMI